MENEVISEKSEDTVKPAKEQEVTLSEKDVAEISAVEVPVVDANSTDNSVDSKEQIDEKSCTKSEDEEIQNSIEKPALETPASCDMKSPDQNTHSVETEELSTKSEGVAIEVEQVVEVEQSSTVDQAAEEIVSEIKEDPVEEKLEHRPSLSDASMSELREIHDSITTPTVPTEVQAGFITHRPVEIDQKVEVESGDRISIKSPVEIVEDELEIETQRSEESPKQEISQKSDVAPSQKSVKSEVIEQLPDEKAPTEEVSEAVKTEPENDNVSVQESKKTDSSRPTTSSSSSLSSSSSSDSSKSERSSNGIPSIPTDFAPATPPELLTMKDLEPEKDEPAVYESFTFTKKSISAKNLGKFWKFFSVKIF